MSAAVVTRLTMIAVECIQLGGDLFSGTVFENLRATGGRLRRRVGTRKRVVEMVG